MPQAWPLPLPRCSPLEGFLGRPFWPEHLLPPPSFRLPTQAQPGQTQFLLPARLALQPPRGRPPTKRPPGCSGHTPSAPGSDPRWPSWPAPLNLPPPASLQPSPDLPLAALPPPACWPDALPLQVPRPLLGHALLVPTFPFPARRPTLPHPRSALGSPTLVPRAWAAPPPPQTAGSARTPEHRQGVSRIQRPPSLPARGRPHPRPKSRCPEAGSPCQRGRWSLGPGRTRLKRTQSRPRGKWTEWGTDA